MADITNERGVACEVLVGRDLSGEYAFCGQSTTMRYRAMGGGFMHLCDDHGGPHASYCDLWDGERWLSTVDDSAS